MKRILALAGLLATLAGPIDCRADTAVISLSGTYAPSGTVSSFAGKGGSFTSLIDYDSTRSVQYSHSFSSDFMNVSNGQTLQLRQSHAKKISSGVYLIVIRYWLYDPTNLWPTTSICFQQTSCTYVETPAMQMAFSANLGTDNSGVFDLSKISLATAALSSVCPGLVTSDDTQTSSILTSALTGISPTKVTHDTYKLTGTPSVSGSLYINTSAVDPICLNGF